MKPSKKCNGKNAKGEPCASRSVDKSGYCVAHRPGGNERMKRLSMKGAIARAEPKGLAPEELGELASVTDAQRWLMLIARSVVSGRLQDRSAAAGIRALEAWLAAEKDRVQADELAALKADIAELRETMKTRRLEVA